MCLIFDTDPWNAPLVREVESPVYMFQSSRDPNRWYRTTPDGRCTCPGFQYRAKCGHLDILRSQGLLVGEAPERVYR